MTQQATDDEDVLIVRDVAEWIRQTPEWVRKHTITCEEDRKTKAQPHVVGMKSGKKLTYLKGDIRNFLRERRRHGSRLA